MVVTLVLSRYVYVLFEAPLQALIRHRLAFRTALPVLPT
jgi:hypothetical protein